VEICEWRGFIVEKSDPINTYWGPSSYPFYPQSKTSGQGIWQSIRSLAQDQKQQASQIFLESLKLIVGDGNKVRFWEDQWAQDRALMKLSPELYRLSSQKFTFISNMGWFAGTLWKWPLAWQRELSQTELQHLNVLTTLLSQHCPQWGKEDIVLWKSQNIYSVKEFQKQVKVEAESDSKVCTVWK